MVMSVANTSFRTFYTMRHAAFLCCLLLLTGCMSPLQRLKSINPQANDFRSSLASEYLAYGESESEQSRLSSGEYYAAKGMRALNGQPVEPEKPDATLPAPSRAMLAEARHHLMALLNEDMKRVAPQKLAHAQVSFDCWQHQLALGLSGDNAPCAAEFDSTMADLQDISDDFKFGRETAHVVSFARGSAEVDATGQAAVKQVADLLAGKTRYRVTLQMYVGVKQAQRTLSEARIAVVRKLLIAAGVDAKSIHIRKYGNLRRVVLSRDKIPANTKVVTITVKTHHELRE